MRFRFLVATTIGALSLLFASSSTAGTALPGDAFPTTYLTPPPNSVPGSNSGVSGPGYVGSGQSTNGRYVVFVSDSDNLGAGYNLDRENLFRKDLQTGDVELVNRATGANGASIDDYFYDFVVSGDGNLVLFTTSVKVDAADADDKSDLYLRNIQADTTTLLTPSVTEDAYSIDLSADGNFAVFTTSQSLAAGDLNGEADVYRLKLSDGTTKLVSAIHSTLNAGNARSTGASISDDGAWVAFMSRATNLVAGFTKNNGTYDDDVYVRSVDGNTTSLVSSRFDSATNSGNGGSDEPEIAGAPAAIGQVKIAFTSYSTDLADNSLTDPDGAASIYLRNMAIAPSQLLSRATGPGGASADSRAHTPSISADATKLVFSSDAGNLGPAPDYYGVYLRDLTTSETKLVSARNSYAVFGAISRDGTSGVWGEAGGATPDSDPDLASIFTRNLASNEIRLVSRPKGSKKVRAPGFGWTPDNNRALSSTGRYFVFDAYSTQLPGAGSTPGERGVVYRRDLKTGETAIVSRATGAAGALADNASNASVSSDGNMVAFRASESLVPADTNGQSDIYVRDVTSGVTTLVSRGDGAEGVIGDDRSDDPVISGDGKRVAFESDATNFGVPGGYTNIFVRDLASGTTFLVSRATTEAGAPANGNSGSPSISYDGSRVAFTSYGTNLSPDDVDSSVSVYLRILNTGETLLLSREPGLTGTSLPNYHYGVTLSGNGSRVAFTTYEEAAVPATAPWPVGPTQVVVRNIADGTNTLASISAGGQPGDDTSEDPSFSRDGNIIAFETGATNLRDGFDNTGNSAVVVRDLTTGQVSGPPAFGPALSDTGSGEPALSDSGGCVAFQGVGHNEVSGNLGDIHAGYIFVRDGTCLDPQIIVPKLSAVKLKPKKFRVSGKATAKSAARKRTPRGTRIRFNLNTKATVTIWIEQKLKGRKAGKKCVRPTAKNKRKKACSRFVRRGKLVRKNLAAGKRTVAFSGRIGRKALKPGNYRVVLQARAGSDKSNQPARPFRIVRR